MNSKQVINLVGITVAVCFASNVLLANFSFAEESAARKAMKEKTKQYEEQKKTKAAEKIKADNATKLKALQDKLARYETTQSKNPSQATQDKIDQLKAQIAKLSK